MKSRRGPASPKSDTGYSCQATSRESDAGYVLHVPPRQLQYWSTARHQWLKPAGSRIASIGASSRDIRLQQTIGAE